MAQGYGDEQQHRRGLVLGLTLAEVLILLLFLLLLALAARLQQIQRERDQYGSVLDLIASMLPPGLDAETSSSGAPSAGAPDEGMPSAGAPSAGAPPAAGTVRTGRPGAGAGKGDAQAPGPGTPGATTLDPKKVDVDRLIALFRDARAREQQLRDLRPALEAAEKIDPHAPPANILKRGMELLDPDQRRAVSQMSAKGGAGRKVPPGTAATSGSDKTGKGSGDHNWPPIISLSEAAGYYFPTGSAELSAEFRSKIEGDVVARILKIVETYKVDVIEVIGHTDEQPLKGRPSNLDAALIPFLAGKEALQRFVVSDNAGLGLARAAAVVSVLLADERLRPYRVLPLSGGQLIHVGDTLSPGSPGDTKERRRIEIRARRSTTTAQALQR
jgi:outer membrane protein OmpA-like peptidoglycan-associated protein